MRRDTGIANELHGFHIRRVINMTSVLIEQAITMYRIADPGNPVFRTCYFCGKNPEPKREGVGHEVE